MDGYIYIDDIGSFCKIKLDYWRLLRCNFCGWLLVLFVLFSGCLFCFNEFESEVEVLEYLREYMSDILSFVYLLLIVFFCFIWFDFWFNIFSEIKYRI